MLIQIFGVTNKEHYGMLWSFWSGQLYLRPGSDAVRTSDKPNRIRHPQIAVVVKRVFLWEPDHHFLNLRSGSISFRFENYIPAGKAVAVRENV